jgi:hypothetical protein
MKVRAAERFAAHGVALAVTSNSEALLQRAEPFLPPLRSPLSRGRVRRLFQLSEKTAPDGHTLFSLDVGGPVVSSPDVHKVLRALEWELHSFLAQTARDRIFVHAGVVEWQQKAIVVPGRSFSGKSTLIAALVRAGCAYLSDEYAILDARGSCHAHPRRISLRVNGRIEQKTAEELGGRTRYEPLPLGSVLVTRYHQGASWQPSRLSSGQTVLALFQHTLAARTRTHEVLTTLRASTVGIEAWRGVRGDVSEFVDAILSAH